MDDGIAIPAAQAYPHIRVVMGMVIGLGVARLLAGVARIMQHPDRTPLSPVHLVWVASVLLTLIHFWWWQFGLYGITHWTFEKYLFVISYAILLFLLSAFLFPERMDDYSGYEEFFFARRGWFFGLMAASFCMDIVDTLIKGEAHFARFGMEYLIRTPILVALCIAAAVTENRRFHAIFAIGALLLQISWILRLFDTLD